MKYTELSQHLHLLRHEEAGRPVGAAMHVAEVWSAILRSPKTSIEAIRMFVTDMPQPFDGLFARMLNQNTGEEVAVIYVNRQLERHWQEFVAIKEMMHCFTPGEKYINSAEDAGALAETLSSRSPRYTPAVVADDGAILAGAEVLLPHYTVERHLKSGQSLDQVAVSHGLHPDVVKEICRLDMLYHRKNGSL